MVGGVGAVDVGAVDVDVDVDVDVVGVGVVFSSLWTCPRTRGSAPPRNKQETMAPLLVEDWRAAYSSNVILARRRCCCCSCWSCSGCGGGCGGTSQSFRQGMSTTAFNCNRRNFTRPKKDDCFLSMALRKSCISFVVMGRLLVLEESLVFLSLFMSSKAFRRRFLRADID